MFTKRQRKREKERKANNLKRISGHGRKSHHEKA